jgi:hypothetical protein
MYYVQHTIQRTLLYSPGCVGGGGGGSHDAACNVVLWRVPSGGSSSSGSLKANTKAPMAPTVTLGSQTRNTRLTGVDPLPTRVETNLIAALQLARGTTILDESLQVLPNIAIQLPPPP